VLCERCRRAGPADPALLRRAGVQHDAADPLWHAVGCTHCRNTGYRGRQGVFELLAMSNALRDLTQSHSSADRLRTTAMQEGMRTLRDDAWRLVRSGVTTLEELLRVTPA
jgi:type II secretory ATPase GspE/PulE/Tfp pilus assembly ATPase PilB-like protein